eukprot:scaffold58088_cov58-Phaeocystis_antarctica.AAC.1
MWFRSPNCRPSGRTFRTRAWRLAPSGRNLRRFLEKNDTKCVPSHLISRRKHPPVSGGKRPLCTLGVPPGRSRGIGGCARAPCVFLAAAEGTA